ncbi:alanine racemase [Fusobacterium sp. SYSU M8A802]
MVINSMKLYLKRENLIHNMEYLRRSKGKEVLPVVKANAYGHGMEEIVQILYDNGQREFAVARYVEAERILKMGLKGLKILIFESVGDLSLVKDREELEISANTYEELEKIIDFGIDSKRVQVKIDFGFGRNGVLLRDLQRLKEYIEEKQLNFRGIYSHLFAVNYEEGLEYIGKFHEILRYLGKERFQMIHLQNSAGVLNFDCEDVTHLRVGMLIYGLQEVGFYDENLKQVFSLEGRVAGVRDVSESKYIAYGTKEELGFLNTKYIAKIKIGYADGFLKINEKSNCLINNKEFPVVIVSMDNTFIEVDTSVKEGDRVVLYHDISKSVAHNGMNIYEMLTLLSPRLEREII